MMKTSSHTLLKILAATSLSACLLVGGAVSSFAAEYEDIPTQSATCSTDSHVECDYKKFKIKDSDGNTQKVKICTFCGDVLSADGYVDGDDLTQVKGVTANFRNVLVYTGTLDNGMEVMNVSFFDPASVTESGEVVKDQMRWNVKINATINLPKDVVEGYTLMLVDTDTGTETPLEVSANDRVATFSLEIEDGTCLIHMVKN